MRRIGVIGAGTMGSGIAYLAALQGFEVVQYDAMPQAVEKAHQAAASRLQKSVAGGKMSADQADAALKRLIEAHDWQQFSDVEAVIEAVVEVIDVKEQVFRQLDEVLPESALLATNTSSLSITEIAKATRRPQQVLGMHFFNPAPVMKLVEIVRGEETSDAAVGQAQELAKELGKETIVVQKDTPGFVVNRVLMPLFIEAMRMLEEGVASAEDIDKGVRLGLNHPMGPLTLADFTGLDIDLNVMDYMFDEFHDDRFAAPLVLRRLVRAGHLGKKTGRGFYRY
ncbi:MAG: 3-hydroxybutyryl-CoA dehydrogenase [Sulfobacillus benefaciens]|uniref:3-hydroxybutyryl-CoA dehydrogenase n=1 Tax=Sulfobacillus benefaciens TaxID=453960 RepID=A0A2T2XK31_9FIRM|nr:MAG: 3-hydroxybutyryl-CoA dehydrogenase [Sulfobacillus benefaciens]